MWQTGVSIENTTYVLFFLSRKLQWRNDVWWDFTSIMHGVNAVNHQCEQTVTKLGTADTGTCCPASIASVGTLPIVIELIILAWFNISPYRNIYSNATISSFTPPLPAHPPTYPPTAPHFPPPREHLYADCVCKWTITKINHSWQRTSG